MTSFHWGRGLVNWKMDHLVSSKTPSKPIQTPCRCLFFFFALRWARPSGKSFFRNVVCHKHKQWFTCSICKDGCFGEYAMWTHPMMTFDPDLLSFNWLSWMRFLDLNQSLKALLSSPLSVFCNKHRHIVLECRSVPIKYHSYPYIFQKPWLCIKLNFWF